MIKLFPFQERELDATRDKNKVAYYLDMGLGKTFVGAAKLIELGAIVNLVICQKSKVDDWIEHLKQYSKYGVYDLTNKKDFEEFFDTDWFKIGVINYELAFRRKELLELNDFTLMLDESSMIQNEQAKRTKFIMKLNFKNLILLSGTPTSGKYERLWSQLHLLGWPISKDLYWRQYVITETIDNQGFPIKVVKGYKNVDRLKEKMSDYGCRFLKTNEVFDLPKQIFNVVKVDPTKDYKRFKKDRIVSINDTEFVGDSTLTKLLYERMLCGSYNQDKLEALKDLLESTEDRVIIFYNFNDELKIIEDMCIELDKPVSIINGNIKDLSMYTNYENSVTLIQYQAGAMGLNLQLANKIIYFTPTLSSELFEQSKKRIHRIGQESVCMYYKLVVKDSIEEKIYKVLDMRKDYTNELFRKEE